MELRKRLSNKSPLILPYIFAATVMYVILHLFTIGGIHMVSMKDVSIRCGVSVATVSKALNGHTDISEATRNKIKTVAKEMGYSPNASARTLKTNRSYDIGVLFADDARSGLTHDYFASVLDGFKVAAEERGYDITFINCNKNRSNRMSYLEHSRYRRLEGVVVACVPFSDPEVIELVESNIPVVTIDHVFNNCISISSDNVTGMRDLVTYIYQQGHRKIAYIHGYDSTVTRSRLSSFYNTMEKLHLYTPDEYLIQTGYRQVQLAYHSTMQLLQLVNPPTCIIYPDDYSAVGGMNAIRAMNLSIPEDISIAGYDGISIACQMAPQLTTIKQDTTQIGQLAAERLIDLIEKPKTTLIEHIIVPGQLIEGKSVVTKEED